MSLPLYESEKCQTCFMGLFDCECFESIEEFEEDPLQFVDDIEEFDLPPVKRRLSFT